MAMATSATIDTVCTTTNRAACVFQVSTGRCGRGAAAPLSTGASLRATAAGSPYVMVVHPAQASTQIVLADTFQTGPPGRRTYRPLQYLTQNGCPDPWPNRSPRNVDAGINLCVPGECTNSSVQQAATNSIGSWCPSANRFRGFGNNLHYHADGHTAPTQASTRWLEYYVSSPAEDGYVNIQLTITDPENLNAMVDADGNQGAMKPIFVIDDSTPTRTGATCLGGQPS